MNGAVLWSYAAVNLMLPRHVPLCLVLYSCAVGAIDQNICKQISYLLFLPNSMPFIINSVILSVQLDRDI